MFYLSKRVTRGEPGESKLATRHSPPATSAGFTLVEMMVAIALFSVLIAVAVGGFSRALRAQEEVASLLAAQSNVSLALEQMTREIRTGSGFCPEGQGPCDCNQAGNDTLSCANLAFLNAEGQEVSYEVQNGELQESVAGSSYTPVTGSNVTIPYFNVIIFGTSVDDDHWSPRVTIQLGVTPNDPALLSNVLNLQTTVTARTMDCDDSGNC